MKIYLVRHGQAAASWQDADDPGLSVLGHQQAEVTAKRLAGQLDSGVRLLSSPLLRTRETALPLAEIWGVEVAVVEAFREIPAPVPPAERQTWLKSIARQPWSNQHPMVRVWHRTLLSELRLIRQPTVIFTHFMVLNAIVGALTAVDKVVCFLPDNASVTILKRDDESLQVVELGQQFKTIVH